MSTAYIGLMSGTSLDGVDGVVVDWPGDGGMRCLAHANAGFGEDLRAELLALNTPGADELHRAALAGNALARAYSGVVQTLLEQVSLDAAAVAAIGCHGQTVRHRPGEFDGIGYTLQLGAPALLAELTGIDVVADFRSRDVAAGGQGAPLAPAFHRAAFWVPGNAAAVLNLGGISNLTAIAADGETVGFDCGPANGLLDHWCRLATGRAYDDSGAFAASGRVDAQLLDALLAEPYFTRPPPKSTGRDRFNSTWLEERLSAVDARARLPACDVQATLAELTAQTCAAAVELHARDATELVVCGGGAFNTDLLARLSARLGPATKVVSSSVRGVPPEQVEACAFAWLARACRAGEPGNIETVTGAAGPRPLGAIYRAHTGKAGR